MMLFDFIIFILLLYIPKIFCKTKQIRLVITKQILPGYSKRQVTVNGTVPSPTLNVTLGDSVEVTIINEIPDEKTTVYFHGMTMHDAPYNDGVAFINQCPLPNIAGNNSMVYFFKPESAGTFWYHGHFTEQYPDGLYGAFIVHDPNDIVTFSNLGSPYSQEGGQWIWQFADWYDVSTADLMQTFLSPTSLGVEPIPDSYTVNNQFTGTLKYHISASSDPIRVRVINAAAFSMFSISIDGLPLQLIELDGTRVQPIDLEYITLNVAQRCSFVIDPSRIDPSLLTSDAIKIRITVNPAMYATYNTSLPNNNIYSTYSGLPLSCYWESLIVFNGKMTDIPNYLIPPILHLPIPSDTNIISARPLTASKAPKADLTFHCLIEFLNNAEGVNLAYVNHQTYEHPSRFNPSRVPNLLFKYLSGQGSKMENASIDIRSNKTLIGDAINPLVIPFGKVVEILINNTDHAEHPFHLHGHNFWIVSTSVFANAATLYRNNFLTRDVISVPGSGWARIRFRANNPGIWQFHCYISWHIAAGMVMNIIESPKALAAGHHSDPVRPFNLEPVPPSHKAACNKPVKRIIKIGGLFILFDSKKPSFFDVNQAQCLAAFLMAVQEINNNSYFLPNFELQVAIAGSSDNFEAAIKAAESFTSGVTFKAASSVLTYISPSGTNKGIDLVIGAGTDVETVGMNQFFNGKHIVHVHTIASDPQLSVGASFPYKISTTRASTLQVHAIHILGCELLHFKRVAVFAVNNLFGTNSLLYEIDDKDHCDWNIVSRNYLLPGETDFSEIIYNVKALDIQVYLLILDDSLMAGRLLEQGYQAGLFRQNTQIIGSEAVTSKVTWSSFSDPTLIPIIMRGYLGVRYSPAHSLISTTAGKAFVQKFRKLPSIGGLSNTSCYSDDTVNPFTLFNGGSACKKVDFSSFKPDGSDIYPYAPHAYDAVYSAAYALRQVFEVNSGNVIDSDALHAAFLDESIVDFEGATGHVSFSAGYSEYPYVYKGDREIGQTFFLMNFDASLTENGNDGFAIVGRITTTGIVGGESIALCDLSTNLIDGMKCQAITYNTLGNSRPLSFPPYSNKHSPEVIKIGGLFSVFNAAGAGQAQCLAAFLMAVQEINNNSLILPNTTIVTGIIDATDFSGTIASANSLLSYYFGGTGVDMVVSTGDDAETEISAQLFAQKKIIQIHTVAQSVALSNGNLYPKRLQTTPLLSYEGIVMQSLGCIYLAIDRLTVFYLDNSFGKQTLNELQKLRGACKWTIVSSHAIQYGTTDFTSILTDAAVAQTRNFIIILDDPILAGSLMEQGYHYGLFVENTQIIGCDEITRPLLWHQMERSTIKAVMRGYIGIHYSPLQQMIKSKKGSEFIVKFTNLPDTVSIVNGTTSCESNENNLDDSSLYFLYGMKSINGFTCSGFKFSDFFVNGSNIYPHAAHVYDAVYALAYGLHDYLYVRGETDVKSDKFYSSSFFDKVNFEGATGLVSFDKGLAYYPYNNRGDRVTGHIYEIYNFNNMIYDTSNGTVGLGLIGFFESENGTTLCNVNLDSRCTAITYNTVDNKPITNPIIYLSLPEISRYICFVLALVFVLQMFAFMYLQIHYRHSKLFKKSLHKLLNYTKLGSLLCVMSTLVTGLNISTSTCVANLWLGQLGFSILLGSLLRQLWTEYRHNYLSNSFNLNGAKISSFKYSGMDSSASVKYAVTKNKTHLPLTVDDHVDDLKSGVFDILYRFFRSLISKHMAIILVFALFFILFETFIGQPYFDYFITYHNLDTTYESVCHYKNSTPVIVIYGIQFGFILFGLGLAWRMRKDLDHLYEPKSTLLSVIMAIICFLIVFIVVLIINIQPASTLTSTSTINDKEMSFAIGYAILAFVSVILICWPPIYEIVSLEMQGLIIHQSLLDHSIDRIELLKVINDHIDLIYKIDRYGRHAFQVALDFDLPEEVLLVMIQYFLPIDPETKQAISPERHRYAWVNLVQKDRNARMVEMFLGKYANISNELATAEDAEGRMAVNIASQACQRIIKESIYFCKRYEILTMDAPVHKSRTCVLHIALDHGHDHEKVAVKLMKNKDQYEREVSIRKYAKLDEKYVLSVIRHYNHETDELFSQEVTRRGFDEYKYCIVMPAADRDLNRIITNEHIAGKDFAQIKAITLEIAQALDHMHMNGIVHGDIKSKNIMRIGHKIKLIDLDACALMDGGYVGAKFSSAFSPPEMVFFREQGVYASLSQKISDKIEKTSQKHDKVSQKTEDLSSAKIDKLRSSYSTKNSSQKVPETTAKTISEKMNDWKNYSSKYFEDANNLSLRTFELDADGKPLTENLPYELVPATYSYDTWSFGVVLFELCAGIPLFLANSEDNVLFENLLDLFAFTDKYKHKRMMEITNLEARNLVSQMLMKDPSKRPRMSQVLAHPFLTGRKAARMMGESAEFDVFISYRVQSDLEHAEILYDRLVAAGLRVWWDKKSLAPGVPWQDGFCDGLVKSLIFLPLMSREALNHPSVEKQNLSLLARKSACDNVLLEYRLALELRERDMIVNVYPVLIGDKTVDPDTNEVTYSDYFTSGCHPVCTNNVIVDSVELNLQEHLNRLCCGTPLLDNMHISAILDAIVKNQGCLIDGSQTTSFDAVIEDVTAMVTDQKLKLKYGDLEPKEPSTKHKSGRGSTQNSSKKANKEKTESNKEIKVDAVYAPTIEIKTMTIEELVE